MVCFYVHLFVYHTRIFFLIYVTGVKNAGGASKNLCLTKAPSELLSFEGVCRVSVIKSTKKKSYEKRSARAAIAYPRRRIGALYRFARFMTFRILVEKSFHRGLRRLQKT